MVIGLGTDLIEIERIAKAAEKGGFLEKYFDETELLYWEKRGRRAETLAGMFAAKEAAAKALETGFRGFGPKDIVIGHKESGAPFLMLKKGALVVYEEKKGGQFLLSISHHRSDAMAVALLEEREGGGIDESGKGARDARN